MDKKKLKFVCISDSHTQAKDIVLPQGDVLIHAGDFTYTGLPKEVSDFNDFLRNTKFEVKIVIAGNHEITFDTTNYHKQLRKKFKFHDSSIDSLETKALLKDCIYLEDSSYNLQGISIYGSPYTKELCNWGFNLYGEKQSREKWSEIPTKTDILITHGGPFGIMDSEPSQPDMHEGCEFLKEEIFNRVKPKYHIFGHSHGGYGIQKIQDTTFINCSILNEQYKLEPDHHKPICFEYDIPDK